MHINIYVKLIFVCFRYRFLINGCPPAHKVKDCRTATSKICSAVLGKADYQLGRTKVFLKDAQDLFLEQERDRVLTRKILVLQRCIRGWYARRRFLRMRAAAIGECQSAVCLHSLKKSILRKFREK